jgi:hypothetical protein
MEPVGTSKHMAWGALLRGGFTTGSREDITGYKIYDGKTPKADVLSRLGQDSFPGMCTSSGARSHVI